MAVNSFSGLPAIPASYGFTAGKNAILNGDFNINQRGFSSSTVDGAYGFDRWLVQNNTTTGCTYSSQAFTPGTAPVVGYESTNFARLLTTGQSGTGVYSLLAQRIENVRTFANQTITISFWSKLNTGGSKIAIEIEQGFGSGGSGGVTAYAGQVSPTTSWARYSVTVAVPSISGKTIGTGSYLAVRLWVSAGTSFNATTGSLGIQSNTFDFWGVQVEAGSVATAFQTATGTLAGELAACQRYYKKYGNDTGLTAVYAPGFMRTTTELVCIGTFNVPMRAIPTLTTSGTFATSLGNTVSAIANAAVTTKEIFRINVTVSTGTIGDGNALVGTSAGAEYIEWSAEL